MFKIKREDDIIAWGLNKHDLSRFNDPWDDLPQRIQVWTDNINKALNECDHAVYAYAAMFNFMDPLGGLGHKFFYDSIFYPIFEKYCEEHNLSEEERDRLLN